MKGEGAKISSSSSSSCELELPAGFRFHPTDDELVMHYLCRKCASLSISVPIITDIDLYKYDPWVLPKLANYGEKEWYFFTPRDRKYPNGSRPNRSAGSGYWKATGADKPIGVPKSVGIKKALVFYQGKAPKGTKTNWIMHEYRLADVDRSAHNNNHSTKNSKLDEWVLCRLYHKKGLIDRQLTHTSDHNKSSTKPIKTTSSGEQKSEVLAHCQQRNIMPSPIYMNSYPRFEQPDLVFQTDQSCCSEHVTTSSSSTWEREVQSEPRMKVEDNSWLEITQLNRDMDQFENELSPLEDMFMYLKKKPF